MDKLVQVFIGFEHTVRMVQIRLLDESRIQSLIKNNYASGVVAGFVGGASSSVTLFVKESDSDLALNLIEEWGIGASD